MESAATRDDDDTKPEPGDVPETPSPGDVPETPSPICPQPGDIPDTDPGVDPYDDYDPREDDKDKS